MVWWLMTKNDITLIYLQINKKIAYSSKQMLFLAVKEILESSEVWWRASPNMKPSEYNVDAFID